MLISVFWGATCNRFNLSVCSVHYASSYRHFTSQIQHLQHRLIYYQFNHIMYKNKSLDKRNRNKLTKVFPIINKYKIHGKLSFTKILQTDKMFCWQTCYVQQRIPSPSLQPVSHWCVSLFVPSWLCLATSVVYHHQPSLVPPLT